MILKHIKQVVKRFIKKINKELNKSYKLLKKSVNKTILKICMIWLNNLKHLNLEKWYMSISVNLTILKMKR